jgi:hypothetical protein
MNKRSRGKPRMGRPPRTDSPARVNLVLAGAVRRWLVAQARAEQRTHGDVVTDALALYRRSVERRAS